MAIKSSAESISTLKLHTNETLGPAFLPFNSKGKGKKRGFDQPEGIIVDTPHDLNIAGPSFPAVKKSMFITSFRPS